MLARLIVLVSVTAAVTMPASAAASPCHVHARLPDRACTPGAVFPSATKERICKVGYTKRVRNVPDRVKNLVYQRYGITRHPRGTYEMDHLIPLELGGSNKQKNLFPQAAEPRPGFHEKDVLDVSPEQVVPLVESGGRGLVAEGAVSSVMVVVP